MKDSRVDLLKLLTVRTEDVKLECLKNTNMKDMKFTLKEMNIAQHKEYNEILKSGDEDVFNKCMKYACKVVMVEPTYFTNEELENVNGFGNSIMEEIFYKIPTIGMTVKEKKDYHKRIVELAKNQVKLSEEAEVKK